MRENTPDRAPVLIKMAEGIAMHRLAESMLPEDERLFHDPYASLFINPDMLSWLATHEAEVMAIAKEWEEKMPGWSCSIRTRVRYFDDCITNEINDGGGEQMVILGAGYDTRVYRLKNLESVRIFELDLPGIQETKKEKITQNFGHLPRNVTYIPTDLEKDDLGFALMQAGYSPEMRTIFVLEGLVMYVPKNAVHDLLSFIITRSGRDSSLLFDYIPASMADGTTERSDAQYIREYTVSIGEPLQSGFRPGEAASLLETLGFTDLYIATAEDFRRWYYQGKNANRTASDLLSVAYAHVPKRA